MAKNICCFRGPEPDEDINRGLHDASEFSAVFGILLSVSGSLQSTFKANKKTGNAIKIGQEPWAKGFFQLIHDLIEYDLSSENRVFAFAAGNETTQDVDILRTFEKFQRNGCHFDIDLPATSEHIEEFFSFVEKRGARTIRNWVSSEKISENVRDLILIVSLNELKLNKKFRKYFINEILPEECRNWRSESPDQSQLRYLISRAVNCIQHCVSVAIAAIRKASAEEIKEVVRQTLPELVECPHESESVFIVQEALQIAKTLNECLGNDKKGEDFFRMIEPSFYEQREGNVAQQNPLCRNLEKSVKLFKNSTKGSGIRKVLFIVSDGSQSDIRFLENIKQRLSRENVTTVCCYLSETRNETEPKYLYDKIDAKWSAGAQFLFNLSSIVPTQLLPRAILLKRGWDFDIDNNETKLFMELNNLKNIEEACQLVRDVVCCQEALSDFLSLVYLDFFINSSYQSQRPPLQVQRTCYANACATVIYLSLMRIWGRDEYPSFEELRDEIISEYGTEGAYTCQVLQNVCPRYNLRCKKVTLEGALKAITAKRPIVTSFYLTNKEWNDFCEFYENNPIGILTKNEIDVTIRNQHEEIFGHAVVLTSFNSQCLLFMNSWGEEWADKGFFRVQSSDVFDKDLTFIDVYWETSDLSTEEKENYKNLDAFVAQKLTDNLKGLQTQNYNCPNCNEESPVNQFDGTSVFEVVCPRCKRAFRIKEGEGNIHAINMYLFTLTRRPFRSKETQETRRTTSLA